MKKLLVPVALALAIAAPAAALAKVSRLAGPVIATVLEVVDGDTLDLEIRYPTARPGLEAVNVERVRLRGLDTPEKGGKAKCAAERARAAEASASLAGLAPKGATLELRDLAWGEDPYGRTLGRAAVLAGVDLGATQIARGLARAYDGKGARQPWC